VLWLLVVPVIVLVGVGVGGSLLSLQLLLM